jgi:hypothetical protein
VLYYLLEYQLWAAGIDNVEEYLGKIYQGSGRLDWSFELKIVPIYDVWSIVERKIYGKIVTKTVEEYQELRKKRLMVYV